MKYLPTWLPDGLDISTLLPPEDSRDAFFSRDGHDLDSLPAGSVIGTAGLRRQAQILERRPDLKVVPFRGNVQTRLSKLDAGEVDATLLALAGLRRLGLTERITAVLETDVMLPAVAQGAIGIEIRSADDKTRALLEPLHCGDTAARVGAERALLAMLDGSCRTPIAALATLDSGRLTLKAKVLSPDGRQVFRAERAGSTTEAASMGADAGAEIKAQLPPGFFLP